MSQKSNNKSNSSSKNKVPRSLKKEVNNATKEDTQRPIIVSELPPEDRRLTNRVLHNRIIGRPLGGPEPTPLEKAKMFLLRARRFLLRLLGK